MLLRIITSLHVGDNGIVGNIGKVYINVSRIGNVMSKS